MKENIKEALQLSFPVMVGYVFLGIAFGLLCQKQGYSVFWAFFISLSVYAGSMQFILLTFFHNGFQLTEVLFVTLSVNARQIFYGISFLNVFNQMKWKKWYMIFALTDETYSLLCGIPEKAKTPQGRDLMFLVSLMNQAYWIIGSVIGATIGALLTFDTTGIDFAMTALFTVIFVEQWRSSDNHKPVLVAVLAILLAIVLFGFANFLLPALILLVIALSIFQKQMEGTGGIS